jgi:hypothetical protein
MVVRILKGISILGLLGLSTFQTACTDQQIFGVFMGTVVGTAIASQPEAHYGQREYRPGHRPPPPRYRGGPGVIVPPVQPSTNCFTESYRYFDGRTWVLAERLACGSQYPMSLKQGENGSLPLNVTVEGLVQGFGMPKESAELFIATLKEAASGNGKSALQNIGLEDADLEQLGRFEMLSDASIERISNILKMSVEDTRNMIFRIIEAAKVQNSGSVRPGQEA